MSPVHQVWPNPSCKAQWKGGRRQGRQTKRWEDNIREWTGLEFAKSQRQTEEDGEDSIRQTKRCEDNVREWTSLEFAKSQRQAEVDIGRQHQGMNRPGFWQVPEGSGEQGKMEETG